MKTEATEHPKMMDLADWIDKATNGGLRALGIDPMSFAIGAMERLWQWVAKYCPAGDVGRYGDARIAQAAGWVGEPTAFVEALIRIGWLDRHDEHRVVVHDWAEHCFDTVHARLARKREWFADGQRPSLAKLPATEKAEAQRWYDEQERPAAANGGQRRPTAPDGGLRSRSPEPLPLPETGRSSVVGSPLPPTSTGTGSGPEKRNAESAVSAVAQSDQPWGGAGDGLKSEAHSEGDEPRHDPHGRPEWAEPEDWAEADRLANLIEGAAHQSAVVGRGESARRVHLARMLQDSGRANVLPIGRREAVATIEALTAPGVAANDERLGKILGNLRRFPEACYPKLDALGQGKAASMVAQAHRLLSNADRRIAPEFRKVQRGGFKSLAQVGLASES